MGESLFTKSSAKEHAEKDNSSAREVPLQHSLTDFHSFALSLQRSAGNRAVGQLLESALSISPVSAPVVQRTCSACAAGGECAECRKESEPSLQRAVDGAAQRTPAAGEAAPPIVHDVLRSSGRPLETASRTMMESRFGRDFSNVRVHTDAQANKSAESVGALAYTVGNHVVFGSGHLSSSAGEELLAHELTHVVQQRGVSIGGSIPIGPVGGSAEEEAHRSSRVVTKQPGQLSRALLQRQVTPQCRRLLNQPGASDPLTGLAVQAQIREHFRRRVGPPVNVVFPDASAGPFRTEGRDRTIQPQVFSVFSGEGNPDLAYRSRTRAAMLLAEIKPANYFGLEFAENQLANYINKGNSPDNADVRRQLGVRVFSPMTASRYRPPRTVRVGRRRFRVTWCGPGIILYKEVQRRRRRRRRRTQDRRQRPRQRPQPRQRARPRARAQVSAGAANFGLGISIGSVGVGAGNVGVGVSIMSEGASVGTVSAGIAYDSQGVAVGAVGAGVSSSSQGAVAGAAGVGTATESTTAGAGVAGAGSSERTTGAAAGAAGSGSVRDASGTVAGEARSGDVQGGQGGGSGTPGGAEGGVREGTQPGDAGVPGGTPGGVTDRDAGVESGDTSESGDAGATAGGGSQTTGQTGEPGQQPAGGAGPQTGTGQGNNLDQIVARLQLNLPQSNPAQVRQVLVDAANLEARVSQATPAQIRLLRILASASPNGVYAIPGPAWVEMILTATADISPEDLDYLATLEWHPAEITIEQLREAIRRALQQRRTRSQEQDQSQRRDRQAAEQGDTPPPERGGQRRVEPAPERTGERTSEEGEQTGGETQGQGAGERVQREGQGERRRRRRRRAPQGLSRIPASRVIAALRAVDWSSVGNLPQYDTSKTPALLFGKTENGTRWGALIRVRQRQQRGRRQEVVSDSSVVVILDDAQPGDALQTSRGLIFLYGLGFGGGGGRSAGDVVDEGGFVRGLILSEE